MAYSSNIPQSSDDPSQSQAQLLANFQALNTSNSVNHVAYNDPSQGKHKFLQMPEQSSAPSTAADEGAVYTKDVSGATELFYRRESNGSEQQLTGAFTAAATGQATLPGGLKIKWGTAVATTSAATITYSTPFTSATYNVQLTPASGTPNLVKVNSISAASFQAQASSAATNVYWMAIGL